MDYFIPRFFLFSLFLFFLLHFESYCIMEYDVSSFVLTCRDLGRYVKTQWKHVRVGDIIHLSCNEVIPADIVVLNSSDEYGVCFIESSNLDGESNLKQRQCVKGLGMVRI